MQSGLP